MGSGQLGQRQVDFEMPGTGGLGGLDPMQQSMQSGQGSQRWMMVMAPFEGATADFLNIGIAGGKWLFYKYKDIIKVDIMSEKSLLGLSWARAFTTEKIQVPNATAIRQ
jgi:hypothetical protein